MLIFVRPPLLDAQVQKVTRRALCPLKKELLINHLPRLQRVPTTTLKMHFCLPAGDSRLTVVAAGSAGGTFPSIFLVTFLSVRPKCAQRSGDDFSGARGPRADPTCPQLGCCCCVRVSPSLSLLPSLFLHLSAAFLP